MPTSVAERLNVVGTANALELRGVTRMFGALVALNDVTLSIRPGERRAVLGSNGAGKTTLFNAITGDFPPNSGTIRFFGEDITDFPPYERIRRGLRRTYQISALFTGLSVIDNVYLACRGVSRGRFSCCGRARTSRSCSRRSSWSKRCISTGVKDRLVAELSYGQQRQLEVALALWPARRASSCSTSRRRACRRPSARSWSRSSRRSRGISATSSSSTTWTLRCASSSASR